METIIGEQTEYKEVPSHLWHKQSRKRLYNSKEYVDTTKCFETMFNPRPSVYSNHCGSNFQSNEQFMMITTNQLHTHQSQYLNNPQSFFVCEQNTSDENVVGSKYLLVPPNLAPGYPSSNHPNAHVLTHQNSLPNHHVGYHRGSVAERSSSIITEHSVTSETPPMIGGKPFSKILFESKNYIGIMFYSFTYTDFYSSLFHLCHYFRWNKYICRC